MGRGQTQFQVIPTALDMEPARQAGDAEGRRPAVAVSAEGLALTAWGEVFADGSQHVIARRVNALSPSPIPQDVTLGDLEGRPGGNADSPDVAMSADSSFGWIAFRQTFFDGGAPMTRAVARRMRGSQFEAARAIDGQGFPAEDVGAPRIAENVGGAGMTAAGRLSGQIFGSTFFEERYDEVIFSGAVPLTSSPSPFARRPVIAFAEDKTGLVAWTAPTPRCGCASAPASGSPSSCSPSRSSGPSTSTPGSRRPATGTSTRRSWRSRTPAPSGG